VNGVGAMGKTPLNGSAAVNSVTANFLDENVQAAK
jgi:hypothetical protein